MELGRGCCHAEYKVLLNSRARSCWAAGCLTSQTTCPLLQEYLRRYADLTLTAQGLQLVMGGSCAAVPERPAAHPCSAMGMV